MLRAIPTLAVLLAACGSAPAAPGPGEPLPVQRLRQEPVSLTHVSGMTEPQQLVIRDEAAWQQAWAAIWRAHIPRPPLPQVDFTREMIVVAALGTKPTGGFSVFVDAASIESDGISVRVRTVEPGNGCAVTLAQTQPVDAARLPRRDGPVSFTAEHETRDCR